MSQINKNVVFDYRVLRLLVGLIALSLPIVVSLIAQSHLTSISASYHTEARDAFVGMLFVVGAFLFAYNGHTINQSVASKVASLAAIFIAILPTSCDTCTSNIISYIHFGAAATLFSILAYFCFVPFRHKIKGQQGKKGLRSKIYFTCGCTMILCMLGMLIAKLTLPTAIIHEYSITYLGEAIALSAFGVAWITAGKYLRLLVDEEDKLYLIK